MFDLFTFVVLKYKFLANQKIDRNFVKKKKHTTEYNGWGANCRHDV